MSGMQRDAMSSRNRELHPIPLTEPYVIVSHHTALIIQTKQLDSQFSNDKKDKDMFYEHISNN